MAAMNGGRSAPESPLGDAKAVKDILGRLRRARGQLDGVIGMIALLPVRKIQDVVW